MPEDKALVDDGEVEDAEDVSVVVTDAEVVAPDVTEDEVEEEEEVVVVVVEEEVEEDEDVVPSSEAPFWTVKTSLTAATASAKREPVPPPVPGSKACWAYRPTGPEQ